MKDDRLVRIGKALANPHRVRILRLLATGPQNVSQLARLVDLSRPVVNMHLAKLVDAGFVQGEMEITDGNAMKNYRIHSLEIKFTAADFAEEN